MERDPEAEDEFARRMACGRRFLAARNARLGRPLTDDELEDVLSEAWTVLMRRLGEYVAIGPLESWFCSICERQLLDAVRRKRRRRQRQGDMDDLDPEAPGRPPDILVLDIQEAEYLLRLLGGMEAKVLRMKHLDGLTFAEIAQRLDISPNTAKTLHYRGLERLRELREGNEPEGGE
ncbi:MAG: RNA polymerase sigma factor [Planctomycetota bacterium]